MTASGSARHGNSSILTAAAEPPGRAIDRCRSSEAPSRLIASTEEAARISGMRAAARQHAVHVVRHAKIRGSTGLSRKAQTAAIVGRPGVIDGLRHEGFELGGRLRLRGGGRARRVAHTEGSYGLRGVDPAGLVAVLRRGQAGSDHAGVVDVAEPIAIAQAREGPLLRL